MFFIHRKTLFFKDTLYYVEGSYIYIQTTLVSLKLKLSTDLLCLSDSNKNMYEVYSSITSLQSMNVKKKIKMVKTLFYYISAFLNNIISNSQQGSIARFRLTGRGYKSFPFIFTYLFKLGYSYLIFYTLPLTIRLKRKSKKKVFYNIMGLWNSQTMSYLNKIKGLKIPDVYCSKGIFKQHEQFQQKEGKKSFTL